MNNRLKFRIWNTDSKSFYIYDYEVGEQGFGDGIIGTQNDKFVYDDNCIYQMKFNDVVDINGKFLYEGDVVNWKQSNGFVTKLKLKFGYAAPIGRRYYGFFFTDCDHPIISLDINPYEEKDFTIEVIGNILENPELL